MNKEKKDYKTPELFDLGSAEAIGACTSGLAVARCEPGGSYRIGCEPGQTVIPLECGSGGSAWQKRAPKN